MDIECSKREEIRRPATRELLILFTPQPNRRRELRFATLCIYATTLKREPSNIPAHNVVVSLSLCHTFRISPHDNDVAIRVRAAPLQRFFALSSQFTLRRHGGGLQLLLRKATQLRLRWATASDGDGPAAVLNDDNISSHIAEERHVCLGIMQLLAQCGPCLVELFTDTLRKSHAHANAQVINNCQLHVLQINAHRSSVNKITHERQSSHPLSGIKRVRTRLSDEFSKEACTGVPCWHEA
mmetsp:Transcript_115986/g.289687  ORF Transcript_115986/g.289687 Transcript_115986/m.289687 type:complete len:240 (-) Transcript_115986:311-1030(-)